MPSKTWEFVTKDLSERAVKNIERACGIIAFVLSVSALFDHLAGKGWAIFGFFLSAIVVIFALADFVKWLSPKSLSKPARSALIVILSAMVTAIILLCQFFGVAS